jgi:hypothetical protein
MWAANSYLNTDYPYTNLGHPIDNGPRKSPPTRAGFHVVVAQIAIYEQSSVRTS